jgi:hypothetical protein
MAFLPRLLLPGRLNAIRNLQFLWTVHSPPSHPSPFQQTLRPHRLEKANKRGHYHRRTWNVIWKHLAEMEGLVYLRVELNLNMHRENRWEVQEFDCVRWVYRPREFHLVLPDIVARRLVGKLSNCSVESIEEVL